MVSPEGEPPEAETPDSRPAGKLPDGKTLVGGCAGAGALMMGAGKITPLPPEVRVWPPRAVPGPGIAAGARNGVRPFPGRVVAGRVVEGVSEADCGRTAPALTPLFAAAAPEVAGGAAGVIGWLEMGTPSASAGTLPVSAGGAAPALETELASGAGTKTMGADVSPDMASTFGAVAALRATASPRAQPRKLRATIVAPTRGRLRPKYEGLAHNAPELGSIFCEILLAPLATTGEDPVGVEARTAAIPGKTPE